MVSQRMLQLGTARSVIRELFEYGRQRAAEVGAENVFDFSLGNPSVPAPAEVNDTAIRLLREQADTIHCYTSAPGDPAANIFQVALIALFLHEVALAERYVWHVAAIK